MWTTPTIDELRLRRREFQGKIALVPTMGALHAGHASLIDIARTLADRVIVSIFVNPTQFGPNEDYQRYPRPLEADLAICREHNVDGVFLPSVEQMYPPGVPDCRVEAPAIAADLEGLHRPGHFAGVCRVVTKLFNIVGPDLACFGQKDFQQLRVIQAMVEDLNFPIRVIPCPTLREPDGLAMSSRNVYLTPGGRRHALGLSKALAEAKMLVEEAGETDPAAVEAAMSRVMAAHHVEVTYAVIRHRTSLAKLDAIEPAVTGGVAALVAGKVDGVRLIDNQVLGGGL